MSTEVTVWLLIFALIIAFILAAAFCSWICNMFIRNICWGRLGNYDKFPCYLCKETVTTNTWDQHTRDCARQNGWFIEALPKSEVRLVCFLD